MTLEKTFRNGRKYNFKWLDLAIHAALMQIEVELYYDHLEHGEFFDDYDLGL